TGWNRPCRDVKLTTVAIKTTARVSTRRGLSMTHVRTAMPRRLLVLGSSLLLFAGMAWSKDKDASDIEKRIDASAKVLTEIMGTPDKAIHEKVMSAGTC